MEVLAPGMGRMRRGNPLRDRCCEKRTDRIRLPGLVDIVHAARYVGARLPIEVLANLEAVRHGEAMPELLNEAGVVALGEPDVLRSAGGGPLYNS